MIIDAHQHVWDRRRAAYPWLTPDAGVLYRDFAHDAITPAMQRLGIDGTILVQAANNPADSDLMRETARTHSDVVGIVAWADLDSPDQFAAELSALRDDRLVVGIRDLVHNRAPRWLDRPGPQANLRRLEESGLTLDFVTASPSALQEVPDLIQRHPGLTVIIDHLGKPPIEGSTEEFGEWRRLIRAAAGNDLVHAKVSGLYAVSDDPAVWTVNSIRPFFDVAMDVFGPSRLMFGSDWPVVETAGGYERSWAAINALVAPLTATEREDILGMTAARVYALRATPEERR